MKQSFLLQHALDRHVVRQQRPHTESTHTHSHLHAHPLMRCSDLDAATLLRAVCVAVQLPKQSFSALLDYIAPLQGAARQRLLDEARRCISQAGDEASKQQPRDKTKAADGEGDQQNSSAESAAASTDHSAADKAKDLKRAVQRAWKIVKVLS